MKLGGSEACVRRPVSPSSGGESVWREGEGTPGYRNMRRGRGEEWLGKAVKRGGETEQKGSGRCGGQEGKGRGGRGA